MEDIIINGVSINGLREARVSIRQGASKFIAENVAQALSDFETLKDVDTKDEADSLATKIYQALEAVDLVAGVSGVTYLIPYYEEYGQYENNETISGFLEDNDNPVLEYSWQDKEDALYKLASLAGSMESDSRGWNSSMC